MTIGPEAEADLSNVSVGDVADVHYTRLVTFVIGSPNVNVSNVPATATVGQVAQTPGGIGPNAATIVGRIVKVDGPSSFDVVNADGGGIYTVKVTNPARQQALTGVCGHRAHADGSSARKAADFLGCCRGRR
jgi:hypothetical protein